MSSAYLRSDRTGPKVNMVNGVLVMGEPVEVMRLAGPAKLQGLTVVCGRARDALMAERSRLAVLGQLGKVDLAEHTLDTLHLSEVAACRCPLRVAAIVHRTKTQGLALVQADVAIGMSWSWDGPEVFIQTGSFMRLVLDSHAALVGDVRVIYEESQ